MIRGDMQVEDIVSEYPSVVAYLMDKEIICIRCGAPVWGTLFELLESKNIEDKEKFILEMNRFLGLS